MDQHQFWWEFGSFNTEVLCRCSLHWWIGYGNSLVGIPVGRNLSGIWGEQGWERGKYHLSERLFLRPGRWMVAKNETPTSERLFPFLLLDLKGGSWQDFHIVPEFYVITSNLFLRNFQRMRYAGGRCRALFVWVTVRWIQSINFLRESESNKGYRHANDFYCTYKEIVLHLITWGSSFVNEL